MLDWSDERLLIAVRKELAVALGVRAAPIFSEIIRWNRAIPQYHVGHGDRVARIEQRLIRFPGLYLGGNAYRGVAINDCVEQAGVMARHIQEYLRHLPQPA
jgi:oxygen-dependent protoporphyrinogen oxidase